MRDVLIFSIVLAGCLVALRRPWIGVLLWTWLSIMNPHRYAYGMAYSAPLAAAAAGATLLGLLMTRERYNPLQGAPTVLLLLFSIWVTLSWLFGLDVNDDYWQWSKVMKIFFMTFVGLALLRTRAQVMCFAWVATLSIGLLGVKGGLFTVLTGGGERVWGPPDSFISDNNEFALAVVMTIPLLRFLQMQLPNRVVRHGFTAAMLLCAASALGSHSRGALLALVGMVVTLWWRGKSRILGGALMLTAGVTLIAFMPETWTSRMSTIESYDEDRSALGRISAWWTAYGIAKHFLLGVGFNMVRPELFAAYSPHPDFVHAAHSIYFLVLGNHGFIGLALFLGIFVTTWVMAGRLRKQAAKDPRTMWVSDLCAMSQVCLVGYGVGGAFLSLSYFDLPYDVMMLVVLARGWYAREDWTREPAAGPRWLSWLGVVAPPREKVT